MPDSLEITNSKSVLLASFGEWCRQNGYKPSSGAAVRRFTSEHFLDIIDDREIWRIQREGKTMGAMISRPAKISSILASMEKSFMNLPEGFRRSLHGNA